MFATEFSEDRRVTGVALATQAKPHGVYAVAPMESFDVPVARGLVDHVPAHAPNPSRAKSKGR